MSKNIKQVYDANPSTVLNTTDLIYIGHSPYGIGDDSAILASNFLGNLKLPNKLSPEIFLSNAGSNGASGSVNNPLLQISDADAVPSISAVIFPADIVAGVSSYATYPVAWIGQGTDLTTLTFTNLTIDGTQWGAATNPEKVIRGMTIAASSSIDFNPSGGYNANSSFIFDDFVASGAGVVNLTQATNVTLKNYINIPTLNITDCGNINVLTGGVYSTVTITVSNGAATVGTSVVNIANCTIATLNIVVDPAALNPGNITVNLQNITGLSSIVLSDDDGYGSITSFYMDMATASLNPAISGSALGSVFPYIIGDLSTSPRLDAGLGLNSRSFSYGGQSGGRAYTFQFGNNGNVVSSVTESFIAGRAASSFNDVFMASDSSGSVIYPSATRQCVMQYTAGFQFTGPSLSVKGQVQDVKIASTYNTSSTISAANLVKGLVMSSPSGAGVSLALPTAAAIFALMTPLLVFVNGTIKVKIMNLSPTYGISISNSDANLLLTGFVTGSIAPLQTLDLELSVTNTATPQITIYGGSFLAGYATLSSPTFTGTVKSSWIKASNAISTTTKVTQATIVSAPYSMMGPILSNDIIGGVVLCTPGAPLNPFALPTYTLFEAAIAALLGVTPVPVLTSGQFTIENEGTATVNLVPGTGFNIATKGGTPVINASDYGSYKWTKDTSSSYALYGA